MKVDLLEEFLTELVKQIHKIEEHHHITVPEFALLIVISLKVYEKRLGFFQKFIYKTVIDKLLLLVKNWEIQPTNTKYNYIYKEPPISIKLVPTKTSDKVAEDKVVEDKVVEDKQNKILKDGQMNNFSREKSDVLDINNNENFVKQLELNNKILQQLRTAKLRK